MSNDRERQAIAHVACPTCEAPVGTPCRDGNGDPVHRVGRPFAHTERRRAWLATKPRSASEGADVVMRDDKEGVPGRWHTFVVLTPLTERGRSALPDGPLRVEHSGMRTTLAGLRQRGLVVMRQE